MRQWRLIYDQPTLGARNMAFDEAILASVSAGDVPPTLRLYAWNPPCLSLGYGQHAREADTDRLAERGWQIVRRPTGGRAILHTDELTYSLALPSDDPLAQANLVESYRQISRALLIALECLGAQVQAIRAEPNTVHPLNPICFETPSHYEITVAGRKLVGSAQVRRKQGILQHGTLPLTGDISRICDVLVYLDEITRAAAKADVHARALTLEEALGVAVDWQTVAAAVVDGFAQAFDLDFKVGDLSPMERATATRLISDQYDTETWTFRR
ncbi:MAG: biotin/lipoate A/B protein ligase family protein [Chloroflexota bacterium]